MKKIFYLKSCNTCTRIMQDIGIDDSWEKQEIKSNKITEKQLEQLKQMSGSYESLFNRRAIKYRTENLKDIKLLEKDYKKLILEEYTFLKRPVIIVNNKIFIGNSKKNIDLVIEHLN